MKLGPVTKLDKRNKATSKKTGNCDVIAIFSYYGHFGAILKPDSRCIACKIFINSDLLSCKN